jgi:hypothetical protein
MTDISIRLYVMNHTSRRPHSVVNGIRAQDEDPIVSGGSGYLCRETGTL